MMDMLIGLSTGIVGTIGVYVSVKSLLDKFDGIRVYDCECGDEGDFPTHTLRHKDPIAAAADFAKLKNTLKKGYPFANGQMSTVRVTDINTQVATTYYIEVRKEFTYHPLPVKENYNAGL